MCKTHKRLSHCLCYREHAGEHGGRGGASSTVFLKLGDQCQTLGWNLPVPELITVCGLARKCNKLGNFSQIRSR